MKGSALFRVKGKAILFGLAFSCILAKAVDANAAALTKLRFLYAAIGGAMTAGWVTYEGGYFQKYGLEPEIVYVAAGGKALSAILAGEVDVGLVSGQAMVLARLAGADIVSIASHTPTLVMSLIVQRDVINPSQLKGKAVGVTRIGSSSHMGLLFSLKHFGLNPKSDVTVIQVGGMPEMVAALQGGAIAGGMVTPPSSFLALKLDLRELLEVSTLKVPFDQSALATTRRYIREKPGVVRAIVRAYVEGVHRAKTDKAFTLTVLKKYTKTSNPEILEATYALFVQRNLERVPQPNTAGVRTVLDSVSDTNPKARVADPSDFVDPRWIEELDQMGFIKELYR